MASWEDLELLSTLGLPCIVCTRANRLEVEAEEVIMEAAEKAVAAKAAADTVVEEALAATEKRHNRKATREAMKPKLVVGQSKSERGSMGMLYSTAR